MKVLIVHTSYKIKGGEDSVVKNEISLLKSKGIEVITYLRDNHEIDDYNLKSKLALLTTTTYSQNSFNEISKIIKEHQPDICHVHNFFPVISPSVYYACKAQKIPVVQTLHNYRLACVNGMLLRKEKPCELCLTKNNKFIGAKNKCYRNSYIQSYAAARMLVKNQKNGTWNKMVDKYICLTPFAKEKFIQTGIDSKLLFIKPNFVEVDSNLIKTKKAEQPQVLFIGRLEKAKGISVFIKLFKKFPNISFVVAGKNVENIDFHYKNVTYLGELNSEQAMRTIAESTVLIFPSIWFEGMPMTIIEAFALKTPVIASNLGAMSSMIQHKKNGLLFNANNENDLELKLQTMLLNNKLKENIAQEAFKDYCNLYEPKANLEQLTSIYQSLIK